jgi:Competence protein CoiA-like family
MRRARHQKGRHDLRADDDGVLLAWARDRDGLKVHVGCLDAGSRRARAPFACIGCGEPLSAKLGEERAHHFAHRPGSACPLTRPETALHLDAKERLLALAADAFARRRAVRLAARCPRCRREAPLDLAALGDAALAEGAAGALRCDVLVTRGGAPALALEVKVTHAVDAAKEAALAALGLPALEIDAREAWLRDEADGAATVLPARSLGFAPCASCAAAARADADRARGGEAAAIAELEAYRARGLMGPPPGEAATDPAPLAAAERQALATRFRCPECGGRALAIGERLARHGCPGAPLRPVAWRGYDGAVVELAWWRPRPAPKTPA